jgi:1-acyl-sn-glycerol-3-phosphate acyltransferase
MAISFDAAMTVREHAVVMNTAPAARAADEPPELLLGPIHPPHVPRRVDRGPVWKTMGYTLDISSRFLAGSLLGKGTVALADELIDSYWRRILHAGNVSLRATGRHHFVRGQPYVVMSNHGSLLDIPSLMGAVPGSLRMVMKEELTKVPVWGQALVASGFVPIDRKNREKAIAQLGKAKEMLGKGVSIWISPEGTRARDGMLAPFKKGGFHLAMDLGVPIIPAWIDGAQDIIPPDQFICRYDGVVTVRFGAPIATVGHSKDNMGALMAQVRAAILELSGRAQEVDATRSRAA